MNPSTLRGSSRGSSRTGQRASALLLALLLVAALAPATSSAAPGRGAGAGVAPDRVPNPTACAMRTNNTYDKLLGCVTVDNAMTHMHALQDIADANDDTRASGTPGYDASAAYVVDRMESSGYDVTVQEFDFPFFQELSDAEMERISPNPTVFELDEDFISMTYSGPGDVTAEVEPVVAAVVEDPPLGDGCSTADFAGFEAGNIALIQRGVCPFGQKASNAQEAGATGVIIYNAGADAPAFAGTLGSPLVTIPVVGTSNDVGLELMTADTLVRLRTDTISENRETVNVFAETPGGRDDNVVMAGAHLDSVVAGPGINDNGSGSAALLEVAQKLRKVDVPNKVRFAWWGAEELGLLGSDHYVYTLDDDERDDIALYLNFDMIASPNYVRFIYDGDGSAFGLEGPEGSGAIEALYEDFYGSRGLAWEPTQISFRSDYAAFFDFDIPFGGLFTGAEGIKTPEEQAIYGGVAGEWYDPCYHLACDTIDNLDLEVFDLNLDAVAFTTLTYAFDTGAVNGVQGRPVPGSRSPVFGARVNAPPGSGQNTHSGGGGLHPERDPDHDHDHHHHPYHDEV